MHQPRFASSLITAQSNAERHRVLTSATLWPNATFFGMRNLILAFEPPLTKHTTGTRELVRLGASRRMIGRAGPRVRSRDAIAAA